MNIHNRRYTGNKYKLMPWIQEIIVKNCSSHDSLFDVFGGTGVVSAYMSKLFKKVYINDFLFSNEIIYKAFFDKSPYSVEKIEKYRNEFNKLDPNNLLDNYVSLNFGGKYFNYEDAKVIGYIREIIEKEFLKQAISGHEYSILIASLLYSLDRAANTVGHYEAYIKKSEPRKLFSFDLITPLKTDCEYSIFRQDSNELAKNIESDICFIDPPYNSRQYSRFYHLLETITKWDKPKLSGVALKPPEENMSEYCRTKAPYVFDELVQSLKTKYIVVTYNNTYDSKSSSSKNKITLDQIMNSLNKRGESSVFEKEYHRFNAGKTDCNSHKEFLFLTKVKNSEF